VLTSVQGAGSVIGGLSAGALMRRSSERAFAAAGLALFAAGVLARVVPYLPVVLGGSLLIGLGLPCPLIAALTAVQREVPGALLGRVAAGANTLMYAPTGLALLLGTAMVAVLDYRVQIAVSGTLALAVAVALVTTGRRARRAKAAPSATAKDVKAVSGGV
jgi:hypothetical protein